MTKKTTVAKKSPGKKPAKKKEAEKKRHQGTSNPDYCRDYLIDQLVTKVAEDGITGINAAKELRGMISEEQPDIDLTIDCYFVPIVFDDAQFIACMSEAKKI
jgi:hypothetical protein